MNDKPDDIALPPMSVEEFNEVEQVGLVADQIHEMLSQHSMKVGVLALFLVLERAAHSSDFAREAMLKSLEMLKDDLEG